MGERNVKNRQEFVRQLWPIYGPVRRPTSAPTNIVPLNDLAWQILESVDNTTAGNCFSAGEKEDFRGGAKPRPSWMTVSLKLAHAPGLIAPCWTLHDLRRSG